MLTQSEKAAIAEAIAQAEQKTSAELVVVIAPASDTYQSYTLLYGLIFGSFIGICMWSTKLLTDFPLLLAIQFGVITLFSVIPLLRHLCLLLVPKRIKHHRAAHRAFEEYLMVSKHVSATTPITLLYISFAEHYAHMLPSRLTREKIPAKIWDDVIAKFTASVVTDGMGNACIKTIRHCTELLAASFPTQRETHTVQSRIIERS